MGVSSDRSYECAYTKFEFRIFTHAIKFPVFSTHVIPDPPTSPSQTDRPTDGRTEGYSASRGNKRFALRVVTNEVTKYRSR